MCKDLHRPSYGPNTSIDFGAYVMLITYFEVIEDKPCAKNVWINTNKVRSLGVHYHLDPLTAQGKVVFLYGWVLCF